MTPERWDQISRIAADALEIPRDPDAAVRHAFVEKACAGDAELLAEVRALVDGDDPGAFLEPDPPPARVGVYRIVREIGRGGMGAVYLAERDDGEFEQRAAIKIVKRGLDSRQVAARFFAERQILARLRHPNIAQLFDGGTTADGRPYFVMEYLDAEPITAYAKRQELGVNATVALFITVCQAVEHAHRHLVLHRDIKPGNILVDSSGAPKLVDFGIAKLLREDESAEATAVGTRPMTLQYSSPEQARGDALSTASDVYALGLLLYELLAGSPPYRVPARGADLSTLEIRPPNIRGDLDRVVLKALEKDPAQRYPSAQAFADDLQRFLDNRPVTARPSGVMYRARKYASRHWRALSAATLVVAVLAAAIASALIEGRRAASNFADSRRLTNSFLFEFYDALAHGTTPARELVERRAAEYLDILSRKAGNDLELKRELAESYVRLGVAQGNDVESNLGKTTEAVANLEKAVALLNEIHQARPSDTEVRDELGRATLSLARVVSSVDLARSDKLRLEALRLSSETSSPTITARAKFTMAQAYFGLAERAAEKGHFNDALANRRRSIDLLNELVAADPGYEEAQRMLGQSLKRRAALYITQLHDPAAARRDLDAAIRIDDARLARNPGNSTARLDRALGQSYLAKLLRVQRDFAGAGAAINQAIAIRREFLQSDPRDIRNRLWLIGNYAELAALRRAEKRFPESLAAVSDGFAVAQQDDAAAVTLKKSPDWPGETGQLHLQSAMTRAQSGDCQNARQELSEAARAKVDTASAAEALAKTCR